MTRIETVVLDMACTTVTDDGLALGAFELAWDRFQSHEGEDRRSAAIAHVIATMCQSRIEVFRGLVDEDRAHELNTAFETALDELVEAGSVTPIAGAEAAIRELKAEGRSVVLTTGLSRATAEAILRVLSWQNLADETALRAAGALHVITSVVELPALLRELSR